MGKKHKEKVSLVLSLVLSLVSSLVSSLVLSLLEWQPFVTLCNPPQSCTCFLRNCDFCFALINSNSPER